MDDGTLSKNITSDMRRLSLIDLYLDDYNKMQDNFFNKKYKKYDKNKM